jgi:pyruvate carboxylase subunit B
MFNPVKVTDVTLRDGQEEFVLKKLRAEDLTRLVGLLDRAGYYSIDAWGGNTFYAALMDLKEDPWQRLRLMRRTLQHTPLQMILRGRMLVGFKPYQAEVVRKFIIRAAHLGVDIFRIYDNLNDVENMAVAIETAKELRKQVEATLLISMTPHVTSDDYLGIAGELVNLGADVICINDSFGVMTPHQVAALVTAYRRYFHQPLRLHLHDNHQTAIACYQEGVRRGAEMVDTTLSTLAWPSAPPPLRSLLFALGGTTHDPNLDMDALREASAYIEHLKQKYRYREPQLRPTDDPLGQPFSLPDSLKDFIREELKRRNARDRQQVAFKEAQQIWDDLGYPALKGRILEIVGLQTVENILSHQRYEILIPAMRDLLRGKFGRLLSPVKENLQMRALADRAVQAPGPEGEGRLLERPGLELEEDILTYSLFPEEAEAFFLSRADLGGAPPPAAAPLMSQPALVGAAVATRRLTMSHKGEVVHTALEGIGQLRQDKQTLFIRVQDRVDEIEVQPVAGAKGRPEYLVNFHGDTYRIRITRTMPKDQEYTPIFLEVNGQMEEFLIKKQPGES